jgi:hypothetical protein
MTQKLAPSESVTRVPQLTDEHIATMKRAICGLEPETVDVLNGLDLLDAAKLLASGSYVLTDTRTHVSVERGDINRALKVLGSVRNFAFHNRSGLEDKVKAAFDALNRYASPQVPSDTQEDANG